MYALSDQQLALQDLARTFAAKEIRPVAKALDAEPDLDRRYPWEVLERASAVGLRTLALPPGDGGVGLDVLTHCLVFEELAYGDLGFALTLEQTWRLSRLLAEDERARQRLLPVFQQDRRQLLALVSEGVVGRPGGGRWWLEGESRGVVGGGAARLLVVKANGTPAASLLIVPSDQVGVAVKLVDTLGRRLGPTADIAFNACSVEEASLLGARGEGTATVEDLGGRYAAATALGAIAAGRAACDLAVDWARRRVQGGKVIAEHPAVAMKLGDMYLNLEASRSLALRAAWSVDHEPASAKALGLAAQVLAAQASNRVAYDAMQVWGGMGFMREGGLEKFTRDAAGAYSAGRVDTYREQLGRIAVWG